MGPGAGELGGYVVAAGTRRDCPEPPIPSQVLLQERSRLDFQRLAVSPSWKDQDYRSER